ncbi:acetyl-CoA carboxylase biotin carboxyl carrier protein [Companilactobacillus jidongensis]|uniref:acetyl-CoA carboxylase biotin carboxyl carrier protein n=1 Tax=Companilactobacillus jidongensis TaxID=2486006 RepID=UPI000F78D80D|nr:biotin/lipoyl-containing protein [Companilactobacillus jidongensis]
MDLSRVEKLVKMMQEANLSHLEVEDDQGHVVLDKNLTVASEKVVEQQSSTKQSSETPNNSINAPFVGTFYASEQPDKAPLVKAGDKVKAGQLIGIIEAMKMMNEVKSEVDGTIDKILVSNGDTVEYDQPLFTLKD